MAKENPGEREPVPSGGGSDTAPDGNGGTQIALVLAAVFLMYLGQQTLNPVIAPLSREVGLAEWQIGLTISTAAVFVVLTSQFWGYRAQSWGSKRVLVIALGTGAVGMALFALVAWAGMRGLVVGGVLFALFILLRGVVFGASLAAVPPTAQTYITGVTADEKARVKGMAGVGAVQGVAMVAGAVLGGALSVFGLLAPMVVVPLLLVLGVVLVVVKLRPPTAEEIIPEPVRIKPTDTRVWPFLLAGFGLFTSLGFIQVIVGFIVQDRLELSAEMTGTVTGGALLAAGVGMIIAQAVVVPRSGWGPARLLRTGGAVATVGFVVLVPDLGAVPLFASMVLIGLGIGTAMPGYTAGPTLTVRKEEQGGLAGLIGATNGLTFVAAPTLGTVMYGIWAPLPVIVGGTTMLLVTLFVFAHRRFRTLPEDPVDTAAAAAAAGAGEGEPRKPA